MKKAEFKQVIVIDGVGITKDAFDEVFFLQHGMFRKHCEVASSDYRFNNEGVNMEIEYINRDIHYLLDHLVGNPDEKDSIVDILTTLNSYKKLLDVLKCPENDVSGDSLLNKTTNI